MDFETLDLDTMDSETYSPQSIGTLEQRMAIADLACTHPDFVQFGCCSGSCPQGFIVNDSPVPLRIIDDEGNQVKMTPEQFKVLADSFLFLSDS